MKGTFKRNLNKFAVLKLINMSRNYIHLITNSTQPTKSLLGKTEITNNLLALQNKHYK